MRVLMQGLNKVYTRPCRRCKQIYTTEHLWTKLCDSCKQKCSRCQQLFTVSSRPPCRIRHGDYICSKCSNKLPSVVHYKYIYNHTTRLELRYGITATEYDAILKQQQGGCALCGTPPKTRRLSVDHLHVAQDKKHRGIECRERVRGLLCHRCNTGLQHFKDNTEILARAIKYLHNPPAQKVLKE